MLTVRPARAEDAQSIGDLSQQFSRYLRQLGDLTDFKLTGETYLRFGFGSQPSFGGLIAEDQGRVIGYLLYHLGFDSDAAVPNLHVVDLYVDSAVRKQGVGRALMAKAATIARERGARELIWSVYHANALATTFYEKLGADTSVQIRFKK